MKNLKRRLFLSACFTGAACFFGGAGCTPHVPQQQVVPIKARNPDFVLSIVIDASGSFQELLETKAFPYIQKVIRGFYRDREGDDDLLIIGQISGTTVAPIFEGSPKSFAKLYGNSSAFRALILKHSNAGGSRVYDSVADTAHYAGRYASDKNQSFLAVISDCEDNFPDPQESEKRLISALRPFARDTSAVGFYWVSLQEMAKMENIVKKAGVKNFVVKSVIDADPQFPVWSEP